MASKACVALKHEITYRKPAFLDDEVIAETVLEKIKGARSFYNTVIRRGEDVLAEVKSKIPPEGVDSASGLESTIEDSIAAMNMLSTLCSTMVSAGNAMRAHEPRCDFSVSKSSSASGAQPSKTSK